MRPTLLTLTVLALAAGPAQAQYLGAKAVVYHDPLPERVSTETPLLLGKTLLQSARRMFPDAPKVYEGLPAYSINDGNPQPIDRYDATWTNDGFTTTAKFIFTLGPGRWTLYFDGNQRLISAVAPNEATAGVTRSEFAKRYPSLKEAKGQNYTALQGRISECVFEQALFGLDEKLHSYSYSYVCPTEPKQ
jgi:hypothetical protein